MLSSARWTPNDPVADSQRKREAGFESIWLRSANSMTRGAGRCGQDETFLSNETLESS